MPPRRDHSPEELLVDGYNLAHAAPHLHPDPPGDLEGVRRSMTQALAAWARRTGGRVLLFFDGGTLPVWSTEGGPLVEVLFSRPPEKADDLIKRALQERHGSRRSRLVTSDRELQRWARRQRIRFTAAAAFLDELEGPPATPATRSLVPRELDPHLALNEAEVEDWARLFRCPGNAPRSRRPSRLPPVKYPGRRGV